MQNEIQVFTNEKFGSIRTTVIDGKPWLVGKNLAVAPGYSHGLRMNAQPAQTKMACR